MSQENTDNQTEQNKSSEPAPAEQGRTATPSAPSSFPEPKVLEAVVDPKEKPKEAPTPFSFTSPKAIQNTMAEPTKGDAAPAQPSATSQPSKSLTDLDKEISADERAEGAMTYDDYKDNAEMMLDMYESALVFISRLISKDTSDTAYEFPKPKREKLERQLIKVLRKRRAGLPIEVMFAGTLIPATAQIIMKASDRRKEYMASKRTYPVDQPVVREIQSKDKKEQRPARRAGRPEK